MKKLKAGISGDFQIRELMIEALNETELSTWQSLKPVVTNFLGKSRSAEYKNEIEELLESFR